MARTASSSLVTSRVLSCFVLLIGLSCGCGLKGAASYPSTNLSGAVTVGGKPIQDGQISFSPTGPGQGGGLTVPIAGGQYTATKVPTGKIVVRIFAQEDTGKVEKGGSGDGLKITRSLIPSKYENGVTLDVSAADKQKDFAW